MGDRDDMSETERPRPDLFSPLARWVHWMLTPAPAGDSGGERGAVPDAAARAETMWRCDHSQHDTSRCTPTKHYGRMS
jgi:hypothetical protein